jgi:hypothetical protein
MPEVIEDDDDVPYVFFKPLFSDLKSQESSNKWMKFSTLA